MHAGKEKIKFFWSVLKRHRNAVDLCARCASGSVSSTHLIVAVKG